jgi:hypothetical protein
LEQLSLEDGVTEPKNWTC